MKRAFAIGSVIGAFLTIVFLWSVIINISKPFDLSHRDIFLVYFILDHYHDLLMRGAFSATLPMFYGYPNSLFFTDHHAIFVPVSFPLYLTTGSTITAVNILTALAIWSSFVAAFLWGWHLTKKLLPAAICAVIAAFNPYMMSRYPSHLILYAIAFLPLLFLAVDLLIERPSGRRWMLVFLALGGELLTSLYYSVFLTVILPVFFLLRVREKGPFAKSIRTLTGSLANRYALFGIAVWLGIVVLTAVSYGRAYASEPLSRQGPDTVLFSVRPFEMVFSAPSASIVYGNLWGWASSLAPQLTTPFLSDEQSSFVGFAVWIFLVSSLFWRRGKGKSTRVWWILFIMSLVFSYGPLVQLAEGISFLGPYRLLMLVNPLFRFLRAPERFTVFVMLPLAAVTAVYAAGFLTRFRGKVGVVVMTVFCIVLIVEFLRYPHGFLTFDTATRNVYETLRQAKHVNVIFDYPVANNLPINVPEARPEDFDTRYLLYRVVLHDKTLLGGNSGFFPATYKDFMRPLLFTFPSAEKLRELVKRGADAIVLHADEFRDPRTFARMTRRLDELGVPVLAKGGAVTIYDLTKWQKE